MPENFDGNDLAREDVQIVQFVHWKKLIDVSVCQETLDVLGFA